jgi:hypothetical protein
LKEEGIKVNIRYILHFLKWSLIIGVPYTIMLLEINPNIDIWKLCASLTCTGLIAAHVSAVEIKLK